MFFLVAAGVSLHHGPMDAENGHAHQHQRKPPRQQVDPAQRQHIKQGAGQVNHPPHDDFQADEGDQIKI